MRRWSMLVLMPCLVACAAVLGLEEAELKEDDDGSTGGRSSNGGGSNRSGSTGSGGAQGGVPGCGYDDTENGCFWSCVNDSCCAEWVACFENPGSTDCVEYYGCHDACADDSDCETACGKTHPQGFAQAVVLSLCLYNGSCPCLEAEGGAGGGGGTPPLIGGRSGGGRGGAGAGGRAGAGASGRGGAGAGGTSGRGGAGAGGSSGACNDDDPYACVDAASLGYCEGGQRRTVECTEVCEFNGFDPSGAACDDLCSCGPALDPACEAGALIWCECEYNDACTDIQANNVYSSCYLDDPVGSSEYLACLAENVAQAPDCPTLVGYCTGVGGSTPAP